VEKKPTYEELEQRVMELEKESVEHKRAEEEIREIKESYDRITDNADEVIFRVEAKGGHVIYVNPAAERLLGYSLAEWLDDPTLGFRLIHPDFAEKQKQIIEEINTTKKTIKNAVLGWIAKDGREIIVEHTIIPIVDKEDKIIYFESIGRDISERKQAEEALRQSEELYRSLVEGSIQGITILQDNIIQFANQAFAKIFGYTSPDELVGKNLWETLVDPEEWAELKARDARLLSGKPIPVHPGWKGICKDGTRIWIQSTASPISLRDRPASLAFYLDVTELKKAEEALRESEEKYRRIVETAQEGIWMINAEAKTIYVNHRLAEMFGYTVNEMLGHSAFDFIDDSNHEEAKRRIERRKRGMKDQYDFKFKRKDGSVLWASVSANPMLDDDGEFIGNFSMISDISDRRRAEEALQESEERYRTLVENIPIAVYRTTPGPKGKILVGNPAYYRMFAFDSEEEFKQFNVADLYVNPKDREAFSENLLANGTVDGVELALKKKDGTPFWGSVTARVLYDESGKAPYFDCTVMDITARKQAEEEKEKLQAQLAQAQKIEAIGTIAGGIAHNFNNLLTSILGNASLMLLETDSDHPNYEMLKIIEKQVLSGSKLTYQLLGYARKGGYEIQPLSLNQLIKETSDTFAMAKKEIRVHRELAKELFGINADQDQIEQVLLNLYVNAADAMPRGGELFLKTMNVTDKDMRSKPYDAKPGDYVLLTVRDTGTGMDKKTQEKIFDPFFTTKGMGRGTGLGLASVYGIVKAHGGYIDVESKKGHGTTFTIYLPASSEKEVIEEKVLPKKILKGKESILLVDDEDIIIDVGEEMLKALGYKVLLAKSGKEAIEIVSKAHRAKSKEQEGKERHAPSAMPPAPDMVLLDMIMPDMGGGETYDRMKEINPDIKVLLSSGYSIDGQATEIIKRGCDGFIQKPFDMQGLSQRIRKILDKK
jgi:PAS domain S-box-containing protein